MSDEDERRNAGSHLDLTLYLYLHATPRFIPLIRTWWVPESPIQKKAAKKKKKENTYELPNLERTIAKTEHSTQVFGKPNTEREWANFKSEK